MANNSFDFNLVDTTNIPSVRTLEDGYLPEGQPFYNDDDGTTIIRVGGTVLTFSVDDDFDERTLAETYSFLGQLKSPLDLDLPDISALKPYDNFPDNVLDTPKPLNGIEVMALNHQGVPAEVNNLEAQYLVTQWALLGAGVSPSGGQGGDHTTLYAHVPTVDGTDTEIRALIFRSEPIEPGSSVEGIACWGTSTLLSTTLRRVALYEMDSDELVEEYDYKGDFIDREGAVKIFSVVSPNTDPDSTPEQEDQYAELIGSVILQWLEPDMEQILESDRIRREREYATRKAVAEARKAAKARQEK